MILTQPLVILTLVEWVTKVVQSPFKTFTNSNLEYNKRLQNTPVLNCKHIYRISKLQSLFPNASLSTNRWYKVCRNQYVLNMMRVIMITLFTQTTE